MLDSSDQVRNKLMEASFVLHTTRNTLCNFDFITLTVGKNRKNYNKHSSKNQRKYTLNLVELHFWKGNCYFHKSIPFRVLHNMHCTLCSNAELNPGFKVYTAKHPIRLQSLQPTKIECSKTTATTYGRILPPLT